jgi:hypothetical protein
MCFLSGDWLAEKSLTNTRSIRDSKRGKSRPSRAKEVWLSVRRGVHLKRFWSGEK